MNLSLQKPYSTFQLCVDVEELVSSDRVPVLGVSDEGRVVGAEMVNLGVLAVTERRVVVACGGIVLSPGQPMTAWEGEGGGKESGCRKECWEEGLWLDKHDE